MIKPPVDSRQIIELLSEHFGQPVERLAPIGTGQISSAYSFRVAGQDYVVRFVTGIMAMSFGKDQFVHNRVASSGIPVPAIEYTGTHNDLHFAISRKVPGVPLDQLSDEDFRNLIPAIIENLDAIRQVDISDTKNYGEFDDKGVGLFPSWPDFLLNVANEEQEDGFYGKWHRLFDETFVERELFDYVYERMKLLLKYCPNERYLVHTDYGFGNVLAKDGKITAVLDWALAMYGDFVYDIAWLDVGCPDADFKARFREYYEGKNVAIPHYEERIVCYQCYICLDSLRWYGKTGKSDDYEWMRWRIQGILENSSFD